MIIDAPHHGSLAPAIGDAIVGGRTVGSITVRETEAWTQGSRTGTGFETRSMTLSEAIKVTLTDELRQLRYRGNANPMVGHCYVASEAAYHMLGGRSAGWRPMNLQHEGVQHWWLEHVDGQRLDITASQFKTPVPYSRGRGRGFLTARPSRRAQIVIDRVALDTPSCDSV